MAQTPVSALNRLRPYLSLITALAAALLLAIVVGLWQGIAIAWLALPLAAWAAVLILRPGQPDGKRIVLFMIGSGLFLTLLVEVVVLRGDIGRMNTVFKFYLQAWLLLAVSAAAGLAWLLPEMRAWLPGWRSGFTAAALTLLTGALMFSYMGTLDKIRDRWNADAPHSLDSMAYMQFATYADQGVDMQLAEDYRAIRWLQDNVEGSPVIVEANTPEYRWGTRFTIYTGLPGVVGWNWHQRQQRALIPSNWVTDRVQEIAAFYTAIDEVSARDFLRRYNVRYVIVGQLERAYYPGLGLEKFPALDGLLWDEVYRDGQTTIYKVK
jgi:uncharacterized membrane protein